MFRRCVVRGLHALGGLALGPLVGLPALAGQAVLVWDASPDPRVTGYFLYYGQASRSYSSKIDVGNRTSITVPNLTNGQRYFFGATTYDAARVESAYSAETSATIPTSTVASTGIASSVNPVSFGATVTFTATVSGSAPTGTVGFTDNGTSIPGCTTVALGGSGNIRTAACATSGLGVGNHTIIASYGGDAGNGGSASPPLTETVRPAVVWVEDAVPVGATLAGAGERWRWVSSNPAPYSGVRAHQSASRTGMHQHDFYGATATLTIGVGDTLYAYVFLDPADPPRQVMLQWNDGTWEHRAYWGANLIGWGTDGTASRRYMGALPASGRWIRLSVPAAQVGLEGRIVNGMAYTLYGGRATWDYAGK